MIHQSMYSTAPFRRTAAFSALFGVSCLLGGEYGVSPHCRYLPSFPIWLFSDGRLASRIGKYDNPTPETQNPKTQGAQNGMKVGGLQES